MSEHEPRLLTASWYLKDVSDDGRSLRLVVPHGVGDEVARVDVREEAGWVRVTPVVHVASAPATIARLVASEVAVELAHPLGGRELRGARA